MEVTIKLKLSNGESISISNEVIDGKQLNRIRTFPRTNSSLPAEPLIVSDRDIIGITQVLKAFSSFIQDTITLS
jgi:hypothetical protein